MYFVCGIPDICLLSRDKNTKYEESYLDLSKDEDTILESCIGKVTTVVSTFKSTDCKV